MAIELRNRLHTQFGGKFTLNATAVFDYPTIGGLAEYLVGQLPDAESPESPTESTAAPTESTKSPTDSPEASKQEAQEESVAAAPSDPEPQAEAAETT